MPWLLILAAAGCFAIAFVTSSVGLAWLCLLLALGLMIAAVLVIADRRINESSRDQSLMLSPEDLRRFRAQADARRTAAAAPTASTPGHPES